MDQQPSQGHHQQGQPHQQQHHHHHRGPEIGAFHGNGDQSDNVKGAGSNAGIDFKTISPIEQQLLQRQRFSPHGLNSLSEHRQLAAVTAANQRHFLMGQAGASKHQFENLNHGSKSPNDGPTNSSRRPVRSDSEDGGSETSGGSPKRQSGTSTGKQQQQLSRSNASVPMSFPQKLMKILDDENNADIVSWLPHGKAFLIFKKKRFEIEIMPTYFKQSKFTSFTRKLNRWGFLRVRKGPEAGAYYHQFFKRGQARLSMQMCCQKATNEGGGGGGGSNSAASATAPSTNSSTALKKQQQLGHDLSSVIADSANSSSMRNAGAGAGGSAAMMNSFQAQLLESSLHNNPGGMGGAGLSSMGRGDLAFSPDHHAALMGRSSRGGSNSLGGAGGGMQGGGGSSALFNPLSFANARAAAAAQFDMDQQQQQLAAIAGKRNSSSGGGAGGGNFEGLGGGLGPGNPLLGMNANRDSLGSSSGPSSSLFGDSQALAFQQSLLQQQQQHLAAQRAAMSSSSANNSNVNFSGLDGDGGDAASYLAAQNVMMRNNMAALYHPSAALSSKASGLYGLDMGGGGSGGLDDMTGAGIGGSGADPQQQQQAALLLQQQLQMYDMMEANKEMGGAGGSFGGFGGGSNGGGVGGGNGDALGFPGGAGGHGSSMLNQMLQSQLSQSQLLKKSKEKEGTNGGGARRASAA